MPLQWEHRESQTVTVALRQLTLAVRFQQQGQMRKLRHRVLPAKSLVEQHMKRCTRQPLLTTDHVRDLHQVVVHDIRQMIGRQLVCTLIEHLVIQDITLHTHLTTDQVVHQHLLTSLDLETYHVLPAVGNHLVHFLFRECQRVAHLTTGMTVILEILNLLTLGLQLLGCVKGDIGLIRVEQLLHIFLIDITTLALAIRTFVAAKRHAFVELDT